MTIRLVAIGGGEEAEEEEALAEAGMQHKKQNPHSSMWGIDCCIWLWGSQTLKPQYTLDVEQSGLLYTVFNVYDAAAVNAWPC